MHKGAEFHEGSQRQRILGGGKKKKKSSLMGLGVLPYIGSIAVRSSDPDLSKGDRGTWERGGEDKSHVQGKGEKEHASTSSASWKSNTYKKC